MTDETQYGSPPITRSRVRMLTSTAEDYSMEDTRAWLARGITEDTATGFRLGVVGSPAAGHERFAGWLSIPYLGNNLLTGETECWSMRFRYPDQDPPKGVGKYQTLPGEKSHLFNVRVFDEDPREIAICEGEINAVILNQIGIPAVASAGSNNFKDYYVPLFDGVDTVAVFGDGDEAGHKFNDHICKMLRQAVPVNMPEGEDVNSLFLKEGEEAVMKLWEKVV